MALVLAAISHRLPTAPPARPARACREAGVSLVEALVAAALFLMIVLGVLPVFTRAMLDTASGNESTAAANLGRSQLEEFLQLPFNSPRLAPTDGNPVKEYFSHKTERWLPGDPPADGSDPALWTREIEVRQFHVSALDDGTLDPAEELPVGSDPAWINLKQVTVRVASGREAGALGPGISLDFQVIKSL